MPPVLTLGFRLCHAMLANQAFASVSGDYDAGALFSDPVVARRARMLHARLMRDPSRLSSLDEKDITILFDRPGLRRMEGQYGHWQYVAGDCVMDLYFKAGKGGASSLELADFHPRHKAYYRADPARLQDPEIDRRICLHKLMQNRARLADAAAL